LISTTRLSGWVIGPLDPPGSRHIANERPTPRRWPCDDDRAGVVASAIMRAVVLAVCLVLSPLAHGDPPSRQQFVLYKFQNRIGVEQTIDDGREVRTVFTFTDRTTAVPLASVLERGKDGTPVRFQLWGNTSRPFNADDRVVVEGG
jgi:hypothetical protein